jgi:2-iminoacetate synthase
MYSPVENEKYRAEEFINDQKIATIIEAAQTGSADPVAVRGIIAKAGQAAGLTASEVAVLLHVEDPVLLDEMFTAAHTVKESIYGKRIVIFAPLYVSNYCVNNCEYCGYKNSNDSFARRRLSMDELREEIRILQAMGHKRLALEAGEDANHCPLGYILECIKVIYAQKFDNGVIRRINVNIAATTMDEYRQLKAAEIGTYILFQETYHRATYEKMHPSGPKHNYNWHATAMHRAMEAGIEDVGLGVLYGLYDYKFETIAMLLHAEHLEAKFGVGPHTVSVPRLRAAENVDLSKYPHLVDDSAFKKIIAILRLAVPYAGLILSTREEPVFRDEIIKLGVSQVSAGSCTGVGGYTEESRLEHKEKPQFEVGDHRSPAEIIKSLYQGGYIPSYCTACYREGRTGERFMALAKKGQIHNVCLPNALITFKEYLLDYGDAEMQSQGQVLIDQAVDDIPKTAARRATLEKLSRVSAGKRDERF